MRHRVVVPGAAEERPSLLRREDAMRRMLVVGTAALLTGLAVTGGTKAQAPSPDEEGVRETVSAFYAALNARDIRAMEALSAQDANPILIHPSGPYARAP